MRQKVKTIIAEAIGAEVSDISDEALLHEDLELEASDVMDLLEEVETSLGITLENKDSAYLRTVEDIFELVSPYVPDEI